MKQIKTVVKHFTRADEFDREVNELLLRGWELKDRRIASTAGEPNEVGSCATIQVLCAELERG
jgi:hypothetical protein